MKKLNVLDYVFNITDDNVEEESLDEKIHFQNQNKKSLLNVEDESHDENIVDDEVIDISEDNVNI